tara:strand:+ start:172 stop:447 length:276 start_codon:yes stop_codon:yes gene_type:complete
LRERESMIQILHTDSFEVHEAEHEFMRSGGVEETNCQECETPLDQAEGPICEVCWEQLEDAGRITVVPASMSQDGVNHTFLDGVEVGEWVS